jgi:S1-C subfamily serine protease
MARFSSWAGWATVLFSALAVFLVAHALLTRPDAVFHPARHLSLGATVAAVSTPAGSRLVITSLRTGGRGAANGLRVGDEIEDVDGLPAPTLAALDRDVAAGSYDKIDVRVRRGDAIIDVRMPRTGSEPRG